MNRDALKKIIKKIVLQEITLNTNNVGTTDTLPDHDAEETLKKVLPGDKSIQKRPGSSKTTASGKHQVALSRVANDCYDVVSITNGGDRRVAKNIKLEEVSDFIKKHAEETEVPYTEKAFSKTSQGHGLKAEEKKDDEESDETKLVTQKKIADDSTTKADETMDDDLAAMTSDSPQMGGEVIDKIEKIIDRVLKTKAKADATTSHLKVDKDMQSPDKLTTKLKDTPALKEIREVVAEVYGDDKMNDIDIIKGETVVAVTGAEHDNEVYLKCASGNTYEVYAYPDENASAEISEINLVKIIGKPIVHAQHNDKDSYGVTLTMKTQDGGVGEIRITCDHNGYYGFEYGVTKRKS